MKEYFSPEANIVVIDVEDIITNSPPIGDNDVGFGELFKTV